MHLTRTFVPLILNLSLGLASLYAAVRFALWTWVP